QKRPRLPDPRERRELIYRRDQEGRQPPVDRLIHSDDGERAVAREVALEIRAHDAQLARLVVIGQQREGVGPEARPAPRAVLERDRRGLAPRVGLELPHFGSRRIRSPVALTPEDVGRGGLPHPETDLEGPAAVARRILLAL